MTDYVAIANRVLAEIESRRASESETEQDRACDLLNRAGVRIMALATGATIGIWRDVDSPEIRTALRTLGLDHLPILFLDAEGIPPRYRVRQGNAALTGDSK